MIKIDSVKGVQTLKRYYDDYDQIIQLKILLASLVNINESSLDTVYDIIVNMYKDLFSAVMVLNVYYRTRRSKSELYYKLIVRIYESFPYLVPVKKLSTFIIIRLYKDGLIERSPIEKLVSVLEAKGKLAKKRYILLRDLLSENSDTSRRAFEIAVHGFPLSERFLIDLRDDNLEAIKENIKEYSNVINSRYKAYHLSVVPRSNDDKNSYEYDVFQICVFYGSVECYKHLVKIFGKTYDSKLVECTFGLASDSQYFLNSVRTSFDISKNSLVSNELFLRSCCKFVMDDKWYSMVLSELGQSRPLLPLIAYRYLNYGVMESNRNITYYYHDEQYVKRFKDILNSLLKTGVFDQVLHVFNDNHALFSLYVKGEFIRILIEHDDYDLLLYFSTYFKIPRDGGMLIDLMNLATSEGSSFCAELLNIYSGSTRKSALRYRGREMLNLSGETILHIALRLLNDKDTINSYLKKFLCFVDIRGSVGDILEQDRVVKMNDVRELIRPFSYSVRFKDADFIHSIIANSNTFYSDTQLMFSRNPGCTRFLPGHIANNVIRPNTPQSQHQPIKQLEKQPEKQQSKSYPDLLTPYLDKPRPLSTEDNKLPHILQCT